MKENISKITGIQSVVTEDGVRPTKICSELCTQDELDILSQRVPGGYIHLALESVVDWAGQKTINAYFADGPGHADVNTAIKKINPPQEDQTTDYFRGQLHLQADKIRICSMREFPEDEDASIHAIFEHIDSALLSPKVDVRQVCFSSKGFWSKKAKRMIYKQR